MPKPLIVVFASMNYDGHQLYDQRLASALSRYGKVLYLDPPLALGRTWPTSGIGPQTPDVEVIRPRTVPFSKRRVVNVFSSIALGAWSRRQIAMRSDRGTKIVYVVIEADGSALRTLPRRRNVHLVKDDYVAGAELVGMDPALLLKRFNARMKYADHVCAVSPHLREVLLRRGVRATVVPAGCVPDPRLHDEPADLRGVSGPRAVFIGMVSDRIDFTLVSAVLDAGVSVIFVGPVQPTFSKHDEFRRTLGRDGFHHLAPRTGEALHAVLQHCDVGLIPYERSGFNDSSFPLKAFEYLAAGLQIVATPLPAMSWLGHTVVHVESDGAGFAAKVLAACASRNDSAQACRNIAADNSWDKRAEVFASVLGLTT